MLNQFVILNSMNDNVNTDVQTSCKFFKSIKTRKFPMLKFIRD